MKDQETQQRFIFLRSQGATFAHIAQELSVSRGTLVNWSRKFQHEIKNLRAMELEALQEQLIQTREKRARALSEVLSRVEEELKKRNIAELSTSRLYSLADSLRRQIKGELGGIEFTSPVDDIPKEDYHEQVQDWTP
jgi:transposase